MKTDMKNSLTRKTGLTLLFYVVAALTIFLLNEATPSGPCTPGLGILAFMLLPFISSTLLVRNFIKTNKGDKTNKFSLLLKVI